METAWVEVGGDDEKRHKYQIKIEPGLHSGSSEVYILHYENLNSEVVPLIISWPEESNSPDLERQILTSVSQYLADRNDVYQASSASLLAGNIEAESKANLIEDESPNKSGSHACHGAPLGDDEIAEVRDFSVRLLQTESVINVVTEELEVSEDSSQLTEELLQVINDNLS